MVAVDPLKPSQRNSRLGFSLTEIIVVTLITAIIAGIAVPNFIKSKRQFQVKMVAERIAADVRYAQHQARIKGKSQQVVFNPSTETYQLPGCENINSPTQSYRVDLSQTGSGAVLESAAFGSAGTTLTFDMYGRPNFGGSAVVKVGSLQRTIQVDATLGQVSVLP